jgi:hypothetical protein
LIKKFNQLLDHLSEYLAHRKGLLPLIGLGLVVVNGVLQFFPTIGWLVETGLLLNLGVAFAILGFLLAWAL